MSRLSSDGFVRVESALDAAFCEEVTIDALRRAGCQEDDPSSWPSGVVHLPALRHWDLEEVAPRARAVLAELVGGSEAIRFAGVQDNLIINFPEPTRRWWPPAAWDSEGAGWHKDGDWFRHFLDSPEQGLLVIVFWRDVTERQGPTYYAVDSIGAIARLLADHPEGLEPADLAQWTQPILAGCRDFRALTGQQGEIVFAHPFVLHTASLNALDTPRAISNSTVMLREPMRFDRPEGHHTPVERTILDALGYDRLTFEALGPRAKVKSERAHRWRAARGSGSAGPGGRAAYPSP
jgi:hypothetical protein